MLGIKTDKRGFTLIELLLYVGITSAILLISTLFLQTLLESRVKNQTIAEVEQQGIQVMETISQSIRSANAITSPTIGNNSYSLTIAAADAVNSPTVFNISDGTLYMTEASTTLPLTNSKVNVSNLDFYNLSRQGTVGLIRIQFTIDYKYPENRSEYQYQKTFISSASINKP